MGAVFINGVPSTEIALCVVDYARGAVTLGTYADALRYRFESTKPPSRGRRSHK